MHASKRSPGRKRRGGTATKSSAARRVTARRAAGQATARSNRVTPGMLSAPASARKSQATKLTATQTNSQGRRSEWSAPAQLPMSLTVTTHQGAWDRTVSTHESGLGSW